MDGLVPFGEFFGDPDEMRKRLDKIFSIVPPKVEKGKPKGKKIEIRKRD